MSKIEKTDYFAHPTKDTKPRRGRPPGSKNKKTLQKEAEVKAKAEKAQKSKAKKAIEVNTDDKDFDGEHFASGDFAFSYWGTPSETVREMMRFDDNGDVVYVDIIGGGTDLLFEVCSIPDDEWDISVESMGISEFKEKYLKARYHSTSEMSGMLRAMCETYERQLNPLYKSKIGKFDYETFPDDVVDEVYYKIDAIEGVYSLSAEAYDGYGMADVDVKIHLDDGADINKIIEAIPYDNVTDVEEISDGVYAMTVITGYPLKKSKVKKDRSQALEYLRQARELLEKADDELGATYTPISDERLFDLFRQADNSISSCISYVKYRLDLQKSKVKKDDEDTFSTIMDATLDKCVQEISEQLDRWSMRIPYDPAKQIFSMDFIMWLKNIADSLDVMNPQKSKAKKSVLPQSRITLRGIEVPDYIEIYDKVLSPSSTNNIISYSEDNFGVLVDMDSQSVLGYDRDGSLVLEEKYGIIEAVYGLINQIADELNRLHKHVTLKGHEGTFRSIAKAGHYTMWESVEYGDKAFNVITKTMRNTRTGNLVEKIVMNKVDGFEDKRIAKMGLKKSADNIESKEE